MVKNNAYKAILEKFGITALNEMQERAVQAIRAQKEIILLSPTGSGKTLAYLLPVTETVQARLEQVQVLILVPSRELAIQIENVFKTMGTGIKVNSCYGGHPLWIEKNNLKHPPAVLIGTPGRIADHFRDGRINPDFIKTLVLDEFDKSLEFGFQDDMEAIIRSIRPEKRILTSATQALEIPVFTGIRNPVTVNFTREAAPENLQQRFVTSDGKDKLDTLFKLVCRLGNKPMLVFCNHRESVQRISDFLWLHQIPNGVFHGGMEQVDREKALIQFRNGSTFCLVTTDLASRGLDIPEIEFIIHYHLPTTAEAYIHRNGRTARMNARGTIYLILSPGENVPAYLSGNLKPEVLPSGFDIPGLPEWKTLYFRAGKKDKINRTDIVGFLMHQAQLAKDEVGRVDVLDYSSYAAIPARKADQLLPVLQNAVIKKKRVRIDIER